MELNFYVFFIAAVIPLITGAIWYNPKVLGTAWMKASGVTEEQAQSGNMPVIFGLTYLLGLFVAFSLYSVVIHQGGLFSLMVTEPGFQDAGSEVSKYFADFMERYGDKHRTFGHGAFHSFFTGLLLATPVIAIVAMFERRKFKYIAIHAGYWILTLTLMGGLIGAMI